MSDYSDHKGQAVTQLRHPQNSALTEESSISGAESLVHTLVDSGVETCFANPGTSEMHFVAALEFRC
jgi:hypothetical protein